MFLDKICSEKIKLCCTSVGSRRCNRKDVVRNSSTDRRTTEPPLVSPPPSITSRGRHDTLHRAAVDGNNNTPPFFIVVVSEHSEHWRRVVLMVANLRTVSRKIIQLQACFIYFFLYSYNHGDNIIINYNIL